MCRNIPRAGCGSVGFTVCYPEFGFEVYLADFTLREEYGAGGVVLDQCGVVRGHDHGTAAAGNLLEEPHDAFGRHGVEVAGGLVGQQHLRVAQQGACDDQPLLLAPESSNGIL